MIVKWGICSLGKKEAQQTFNNGKAEGFRKKEKIRKKEIRNI